MKLFCVFEHEEYIEGYSAFSGRQEFFLANNIEQIYKREKGDKTVIRYWIGNKQIDKSIPHPEKGYGIWTKNKKFNFKKDLEKITRIEFGIGFGRSLIISEEKFKTI
jgi:hypothetical protein